MEEDDSADARIHAVVGREQQLAVPAPVLLRVLRPHRAQPLGDAACTPVRTSMDQLHTAPDTGWPTGLKEKTQYDPHNSRCHLKVLRCSTVTPMAIPVHPSPSQFIPVTHCGLLLCLQSRPVHPSTPQYDAKTSRCHLEVLRCSTVTPMAIPVHPSSSQSIPV